MSYRLILDNSILRVRGRAKGGSTSAGRRAEARRENQDGGLLTKAMGHQCSYAYVLEYESEDDNNSIFFFYFSIALASIT